MGAVFLIIVSAYFIMGGLLSFEFLITGLVFGKFKSSRTTLTTFFLVFVSMVIVTVIWPVGLIDLYKNKEN